MVVGEIVDDDFDRVQHEHEPWDRYFQITTYGSFEAFDFNVGYCFSDA